MPTRMDLWSKRPRISKAEADWDSQWCRSASRSATSRHTTTPAVSLLRHLPSLYRSTKRLKVYPTDRNNERIATADNPRHRACGQFLDTTTLLRTLYLTCPEIADIYAKTGCWLALFTGHPFLSPRADVNYAHIDECRREERLG